MITRGAVLGIVNALDTVCHAWPRWSFLGAGLLLPLIRILVIGVGGGLALAWVSAAFFHLQG